MFSLVPPVGSVIHLNDAAAVPKPCMQDMRLYGSGTAALAAALEWICEVRPDHSDVLLPAYGCPALVSAVQYAGLRPVLVDLAPDSPFPEAGIFERSAAPQTAACVHVNFLGLPPPEPGTDTRGESDVLHVYDSCQAWPEGGRCPPWADVTVVSFGRGKPVTLGSGGGVMPNERHSASLPCAPTAVEGSKVSFRLKAALLGLALRPRMFWWVDRLPWLNIGVTRYSPLSRVDGMNVHAARLVGPNVAHYLKSGSWTVERARELFAAWRPRHFKMPAGMAETAGKSRLLRLPLLADSQVVRDRAVKKLRKAGFAGTAMYGSPLWTFAGLESLRDFESDCPNATSFAGRLLTLPVHNGVGEAAMISMLKILRSL